MIEDNTETIEESARVGATAIPRAMESISATYSKDYIRNITDEGEIGIGLLLTSVRLESLLVNRFKEHHGKSEKEFKQQGLDEKSLGYFLQCCIDSDLIEGKHHKKLKELKNERNNLAHDVGRYADIQLDPDTKEEVSELIYDVLKFLEEA